MYGEENVDDVKQEDGNSDIILLPNLGNGRSSNH